MLFCHPHDLAKVERIAQRMRQDDSAGAGGDSRLDQGGLHVVGRDVGVDEDGNEPVLQQRVHRGREPGGAGDHLVTGSHGAITQAR